MLCVKAREEYSVADGFCAVAQESDANEGGYVLRAVMCADDEMTDVPRAERHAVDGLTGKRMTDCEKRYGRKLLRYRKAIFAHLSRRRRQTEINIHSPHLPKRIPALLWYARRAAGVTYGRYAVAEKIIFG